MTCKDCPFWDPSPWRDGVGWCRRLELQSLHNSKCSFIDEYAKEQDDEDARG